MIALDFTPFVPNDTPEVAALKEKVREVANKYTKKHGWCAEVKRALSEMGIDYADTLVKIKVITSHPFEFTIPVKPQDYVGLDEAGQRDKLAESLQGLSVGGVVSGTLSIPASSITSMELVTRPPNAPLERASATATEEETYYAWRYSSERGKLLHRFRRTDLAEPSGWRSTWDTHVYATCSEGFDRTRVTETSPVGIGARCRRCAGGARSS